MLKVNDTSYLLTKFGATPPTFGGSNPERKYTIIVLV